MKLWIRWSGILGFIAITALVVLIWLFAIGPLIKYSIETFGSKAANAKVEVESVSLTFDPLGIAIEGVQVANSDKPMENLLQFDRAVADIELLPLMLGKGIINEVALTGMEFSTPRKTSGALEKDQDDSAEKKKSTKEKLKETQELIGQKLPSADELLEREPLLTEQRGTEFKSTFEQVKADTDKALAGLPDQNALASYEDQFNKLISGKLESVADFQQKKKELDALKKRIKNDQKALKQAQTVITEGKENLQQGWSGLQSAPGEDLAHLKSKYQLDGAGVANLSRLLFGDEVGNWSQKGLYWYEKIRPFLASSGSDETLADVDVKPVRQEGRFVHFKTDRPLPDMLIRKMQLAVTLPTVKDVAMGDVDVSIYDITHQQNVINRPIRLVAKGNNLKNIQSLNLTGTLDHRQAPGKDSFDLDVKGMALNDYNVGAMGLKLDRSQIDIIGHAEFVKNQIQATSKANFSQAVFSTKDKTLMAKEVSLALQKVPNFDINASAKGKLVAPKVELSSNLDRQMSAAFKQRLNEKQGELEAQLKQKLNEKLLAYAGDYQQQIKELDLANGSLNDKLSKLQDLAETELTSFQQQQEAEAQRKLDEKRKEQEAKAQAEADKKKKELEDNLKNKFKSMF